jgi:hypothetical protein
VLFGDVTAVLAAGDWSDKAVTFIVPATDITGQAFKRGQTVYGGVLMPSGGQGTNTLPFTFGGPWIESLNPASAPPKAQVTISGTGFGPTNLGHIAFGDTTAETKDWSDTAITFVVPEKDKSGTPYPAGRTVVKAAVTVGNLTTSVDFAVTKP